MTTIAEMRERERVRELATRPAVHTATGAGGFSYRVVEDREGFVLLILRDGEEPRISRRLRTHQHAVREVEQLVILSRAIHAKVGKRA